MTGRMRSKAVRVGWVIEAVVNADGEVDCLSAWCGRWSLRSRIPGDRFRVGPVALSCVVKVPFVVMKRSSRFVVMVPE